MEGWNSGRAMDEVGEITALLEQLGDTGMPRRTVLERLMPLIYTELKRLAHANRYRYHHDLAPGTTSLVHEAYLKIAARSPDCANRKHFYRIASKAMRSILIDNARSLGRLKRGGGAASLPLHESQLVSLERTDELIELNDALDRLGDRDARLAQIVECRCFGGLSVEETAEALEVSPATVKRGWSFARTWLYHQLRATAG